MGDFIIITDSSCDMSAQMAEDLGVEVLPLSVTIGEDTYKNYLDGREIAFPEFYKRLRGGQSAKTSAVNTESFVEIFKSYLDQGKDLLYLGFSSGLSATCQCGEVAARMVADQYPERKICVVDTLAASMGQGLLVYLAVMKQREGMAIEGVRDYIESIKLKLVHWFTVDDLHFLKRGGRISAATEIVGSLLSIKPVMRVDNEGHLIKVEAVRGRKAAIRRMKEKMEATCIDPKNAVVFMSHGDCIDDAKTLEQMIREQFGTSEIHINFVGPVIGAHSGPGTLALFYIGTER